MCVHDENTQSNVLVFCSVLQRVLRCVATCVVVRCRAERSVGVLQGGATCVAVCCSVLQGVAAMRTKRDAARRASGVGQSVATECSRQSVATECKRLQQTATHCISWRQKMQSVAVCCSLLHSAAVCCSLLQCGVAAMQTRRDAQRSAGRVGVGSGRAVCCSLLQCLAACCSHARRDVEKNVSCEVAEISSRDSTLLSL